MAPQDRDTAPGEAPRPLLPNWLPRALHRGNGMYAARSVYGSVIVLAVLMTLRVHPPPAFRAALIVAGTVLSVLAAEAYSDLLGREIKLQRRLTREERRALLGELGVIMVSAEAPVLVLVLAGFGLYAEDVAFAVAIWLTIVLMGVDGFLANRLAGFSTRSAVLSGLGVSSIGVALAIFKAIVH
jgi:hypothetical protein